jgi:hypothetical protein
MQMPCRLVYSAGHTFFRLYCSDNYWTSGAHEEVRTPDLQIRSSVALEHGGLIEPLLAIPTPHGALFADVAGWPQEKWQGRQPCSRKMKAAP